jgi:hypothetical protein
MPRQKTIFSIIIISLIGLNIWHWWPENDVDEKGHREDAQQLDRYNIEKIKLNTMRREFQGELQSGRDLFFTKKPESIKPAKPAKKIVKRKPKPKQPSAFELAVREAQTELTKFSLIGIAERGGEREAFLVFMEETFIVRKGSDIKNKYIVTDIKPDNVEISVPELKIKKTIELTK